MMFHWKLLQPQTRQSIWLKICSDIRGKYNVTKNKTNLELTRRPACDQRSVGSRGCYSLALTQIKHLEKGNDVSRQLLYGMLCFFIAQLFVWFQSNSQLVWDWWKDKPITSVTVFALPIGLCFWYGTKYIYESTSELWTARLIGFGMSYLTFPILTHYLLGESMFTAKTLISTMLAV